MSRLTKLALGVSLATAMVAGTMPAYAVKVNDDLKVNGKIFADYQSVDGLATTAADDAASGFHFTRAYFETRYSPDADNMFRITLDQKASGASDRVFVKYAYWQSKLNDNVSIKVGQNHTPLVDYLQTKMWGHRYVAKTFTDAVGAQTSADQGVSVFGKGDTVDYYVSYMNGEGYLKDGDGTGAAIMGRVEFHTGGVHVGAFAHSETDRGGTAGYDPRREVVYAWWENDQFQIGGQYLTADDGNAASFDSGSGYNILANIKLPSMGKKTTLFARYDSVDKMDSGTDETLTIAGVEFEAAPGVKLAPNVQTADDGVNDAVTTIGINTQFKF